MGADCTAAIGRQFCLGCNIAAQGIELPSYASVKPPWLFGLMLLRFVSLLLIGYSECQRMEDAILFLLCTENPLILSLKSTVFVGDCHFSIESPFCTTCEAGGNGYLIDRSPDLHKQEQPES